MSSTQIYTFGYDGLLKKQVDIRNAWRGCMQVWTLLERKYLPSLPKPIWSDKEEEYYYRTHHLFTMEAMQEIWSLADTDKLTRAEHIVLRTTFDKFLVEGDKVKELCHAFRDFEGEHSLKEQADGIEAMWEEGDTAIGFNQTSVNQNPWRVYIGEDEDISYNCLTGNNHHWLFKDLERI